MKRSSRFFALVPVLVVMAGCGTSGPTAPTTGSLEITVTGVPGGSASITVSHPGFNQVVTRTTTLSNLTPGVYTLTVQPVVVSNATYASTPAVMIVTVVASATPTSASVTYALASGSLTITVVGLPGGPAAITVTGPGFDQMVTGTTTLSNLTPGTYTISVADVVVSNSTYAPMPISSTVAVTASATPTPATVTYVVITPGSLQLNVSPAGPSFPMTVTGPYGFEQRVGRTTLLSELTPGAYTIVALPVSLGGSSRVATWYPHPARQTVTVSASANDTASVSFAEDP
jgi:hypothetical protein